jgi:signal peptidase II
MKHRWTDNLRSPIALLLFFGVAAVGLFADLWSKSAAKAKLDDGEIVHFIPNVLNFTYTENRGAVFGLGQGQQTLFLLVSIGAVAFLIFLFLSSGKSRIYQLILGMLLAGVLGNMYDRVAFGYVRDMIHALPGCHWPSWVVDRLPNSWQPPLGRELEVFPWIFNIADSLLCTGVAAMLVFSFISEFRRKHESGETPSDGNSSDPQARLSNPSPEKA